MSTRPESVMSEATTLQAEQAPKPPTTMQYHYVEQSKKGPQPDYVPKPKSKFSKFLSKFQSPAVKSTLAAREAKQVEDIRKGVKTTQVSDVGRSSNAWAATSLAP
ncbi:hypothetical protein QBC37DRAFT_427113 [Rhypophila decipiens]|uniref:Uncharacterized protein n=1 Tax=Rhypophila decipiens TaxID=261697 RepID=A0AAN7B571_9PEZI|nr:hypothetical protein QBC37DRAFT_427113 [Rhypophila decipiens]